MYSSTQSASLAQKHFNAVSEQYDEYAFIQRLVSKELVKRLELLKINVTKILDLGVGTGHSVHALHDQFSKAELVLLDSSKSMLEIAKKKLNWKQRLFKTVRLHQAHAEQTALADESIDLVISNLLLPYVENMEEIFSEAQRITRSEGVFCFTSFGPDTLIEFQSILSNIDTKNTSIQFGQLSDMHIVGDSLLKTGFREPVMDVDKITLSFSDFDSLWSELFYSGLIFGECDQKMKSTLAASYEEYRREDGLPVSFEIIFGQAWANSNQVLQERADFQRDGVFSYPLERLKRR